MGVLIQIRNVPEDVHRTLKSRAALQGRTLSDYLREELVELAGRPTPDEVWERIKAQPTVDISGAEIIRAERDAREP